METVGYKINKSKMEALGLLLKSLPEPYKYKKADVVDIISLEKDQLIYIICLANITYILCPDNITKHMPNECIPLDDLSDLPLDTLRGNTIDVKSDLENMVSNLEGFMDANQGLDEIREQTEYMKTEDLIDVIELKRKSQCKNATVEKKQNIP